MANGKSRGGQAKPPAKNKSKTKAKPKYGISTGVVSSKPSGAKKNKARGGRSSVKYPIPDET